MYSGHEQVGSCGIKQSACKTRAGQSWVGGKGLMITSHLHPHFITKVMNGLGMGLVANNPLKFAS